MPLANPPPNRIPGCLRTHGLLRNPDALLEPLPSGELAGRDECDLLLNAPLP